MALSTIKTFETPIEAHLLKVKFESEDVHCFLFDEEIVQLNPLYNVATGGVKLKVRKRISKEPGIMLQKNREVDKPPCLMISEMLCYFIIFL